MLQNFSFFLNFHLLFFLYIIFVLINLMSAKFGSGNLSGFYSDARELFKINSAEISKRVSKMKSTIIVLLEWNRI